MISKKIDTSLNYTFSREIETNTIRLRLLSNGVVHYTYLADADISADEHIHNHKALVEVAGKSMKRAILVDAEDVFTLSAEARTLIRELESVVPISYRAIVVKSLSERILANFYITYYKPLVPTKVFTNSSQAMLWLKQFNDN